MPETAIGFFPDVGASSFLSRAPCGLGKLLALSGRRLRGRELLWAGLATHYVPSSHLSALEDALVSAFNDSSVRVDVHDVNSEVQSLHTIDRVLTSFHEVCTSPR
jgi:enoyl-CoA hydratase/carnithine racemase